MDNTNLVNLQGIDFAVGDDLVLFMYTSPVAGRASNLLTPEESVYRFTAANEMASGVDAPNNSSMVLEKFVPTNALTLTLGDLDRIAAEYRR